MNKKEGISLLLPTQNAEKTLELCINSFYNFADEIIIVDNGSSDNTINICKRLSSSLNKVLFFNKPNLKDLYENRQYALEQSSYSWIARLDSDYIAYTDCEHDILELRKIILKTAKNIFPIYYTISQVNLCENPFFTGKLYSERTRSYYNNHIQGKYVPETMTELSARIIQYSPLLKFVRKKRWESIRFKNLYKEIKLNRPYWFHCEFKSKIDYLYRSERTNWRENGNFRQYPTLKSYLDYIVPIKYNTKNLDEAADIYFNDDIKPVLIPYDEKKYYKYPKTLLNDYR